MNLKSRFTILFFCFSFFIWSQEQLPADFILHRVKAKETIYGLTKRYGITAEQLFQFNPLVGKVGLKKRMNIRIPVYIKPVVNTEVIETPEFHKHLVKPKETKWRLAYQYGITVTDLEELNPEIKEGLKIGQILKIPNNNSIKLLPENDKEFNYYTVKPKEGYFRIQKKLGINKAVLDSLNPEILNGGLKAGMILKIPKEQTGSLKIQDDLLVETVTLLDSIKEPKQVTLAVMLPFKINRIQLDSISQTKEILSSRNLHTISLDFYSGIRMAAETAAKAGISVDLSVFDTENSMMKIQQKVKENDFSKVDALIGPLIPTNFDFASILQELRRVPKVSPLTTNQVKMRKNVFQSVTQKQTFRKQMFEFLERELDTTQNIVVVADSLNRSVERSLLSRFPRAKRIRPEKSGYLLPELVDSLLVDSLPNKVILETESFPLISSVLSQMNSQNTVSRTVQVYTTFHGKAYENDNLSRKQMGGVLFTYASGSNPALLESDNSFKNTFVNQYGKLPNKEVLRAYDLTLDLILRIAYSGRLEDSIDLGETQYEGNRFQYVEAENGAYQNQGFYLLQHRGYEIIELKK
ncbi:LysM peptidoglycan-binding domain-containing protein [Flavobacteriaceae bacterium]|nr:LysM peptidoglycan-binding domain-containing protein [Flavobacteriaceae bacterium]